MTLKNRGRQKKTAGWTSKQGRYFGSGYLPSKRQYPPPPPANRGANVAVVPKKNHNLNLLLSNQNLSAPLHQKYYRGYLDMSLGPDVVYVKTIICENVKLLFLRIPRIYSFLFTILLFYY